MHNTITPDFATLIAPESHRIAVAVSGGADSMALALLAQAWAKAHDRTLVALTVDHGLRPESRREAEQVHAWLTARDITHHILTWDGDKSGNNLQARARKARYTLLTDWCKAQGIGDLLVAHHQQDQAETVLLHLLRGSGVDGLAGMVAVTRYDGVRLLRPLLHVSKAALQEYLQREQQPWVEDPSNENPKFTRVQVRQFLELADDPALFIQRLAQTSSHMQRARLALEQATSTADQHCVTWRPEGWAILDMALLRTLPEEIGLRLLSQVVCRVSGHQQRPRFERLKAVYDRICRQELTRAVTLWGCKLWPSQRQGRKQQCFIFRELAAIAPALPLAAEHSYHWDGRFQVTTGSIGMGCQLACLGKSGYSLLPRLPDWPFPKEILYTLPAVWQGERLVYVPYVGYTCEEHEVLVVCTSIQPSS